ncbi:MAG: cytochrome C oxidase subunit IV family protein [Pirellulaceae bacterium]|nr:cytochrome C oxidase subunit IV family protein [Pirellulaceae bacterium]
MSDSTTHAGAHAHGHDDGHHGFAHPMAIWKLLAVFFALVFLTWVTVVQSKIDTGNLEIWLSLFIATVKAALVILFFMHMIHEKPFNAIVFISSFIFVALFLGLTLMDAHNYKDKVELTQPAPVVK